MLLSSQQIIYYSDRAVRASYDGPPGTWWQIHYQEGKTINELMKLASSDKYLDDSSIAERLSKIIVGVYFDSWKKVCFSYPETKILFQDGSECDYADPLPYLLGYGRSLDCGAWVGDLIGADDELPTGIIVLESVTLEW